MLTFGRPLQRFTGSLANSQQTFAIFREKSFEKEEGPTLLFPEQARRYFPNFHPKLSSFSASLSEKDFCYKRWQSFGTALGCSFQNQPTAHDPRYRITQNSYQLLETTTQIRTLTASAIVFFYQIVSCCSLDRIYLLIYFFYFYFLFFLQKINLQFVKAYFTSADLDKNRVR